MGKTALAKLLGEIRKNLLLKAINLLSPHQRSVAGFRCLAATSVQSIGFERNGVYWTVPPDDIGMEVFTRGGFELPQIQALADWMRGQNVISGRRNVVIDAGANIGTTSIPLVRSTGCRVLAIEPVSGNFQCLERNVEANGLRGCILVAHRAVLREPGVVKMVLTDVTSGSHYVVRDGISEFAGLRTIGYEDVQADTLEGIVAGAGLQLDEIAMVWADIQGCELDLVETGANLWSQGVPLWAEIEPESLEHQRTLARFPQAAAEHFRWFIPASDVIQDGPSARKRPISELNELILSIPKTEHTDVLFVPGSAQE
jgi:FkbM family methyltransferase